MGSVLGLVGLMSVYFDWVRPQLCLNVAARQIASADPFMGYILHVSCQKKKKKK